VERVSARGGHEEASAALTREEVVRGAAGAALALSFAALPGLACEKEETPRQGAGARRYFLTEAEVARMRRNVDDPGKPWAATAFGRTLEVAGEGLRERPRAPTPTDDYSAREAWHPEVYEPGLRQGRYVWCQALAYAVLGDERYAESAKGFMLEWATTYTWPEGEGGPRVGHQVAEPVGFMVKAFLAYDLLREQFSVAERETFEAWASLFVPRGMRQADQARDRPWTPTAAVTNGACWARCLAVVAAAVQGGSALREALEWNWSHETPGTTSGGEHFDPHDPLDYGWKWLIENAMRENGKMVEEEQRTSVDYALYTWHPLHFIADVDRHVGDRRLYEFETESGKSLHLVMEYYARYLTEEEGAPYATPSDPDADGTRKFSVAVEAYRAAAEQFRNAFPRSPVLKEIVSTGGNEQRGHNFDPHIVAYGAVLGELSEA
jgi:Alginate lyase